MNMVAVDISQGSKSLRRYDHSAAPTVGNSLLDSFLVIFSTPSSHLRHASAVNTCARMNVRSTYPWQICLLHAQHQRALVPNFCLARMQPFRETDVFAPQLDNLCPGIIDIS